VFLHWPLMAAVVTQHIQMGSGNKVLVHELSCHAILIKEVILCSKFDSVTVSNFS
jgi:hypothetical protein